ncbi:23S rRNA (uridine2552-2'-O)-methyltransferase [Strigomonas culicis]|uniref:rRNA methyltransferase 2, mitochondrial n=1 Tax=Strigomonas culicis TaxID=28005 RepID=S9VJT4_9TRYP|nr:23S rRNA (uridine2552-2'-O)-methyltransferase [Strigomonas culicis]EPY32047.1 23S rRNA (uridine2552-2'-O)-methyltransferase [Strigomonas culicis]|eukprot:EPY27346.1 23S rRNA (uridine2552-2'-O)-methyltransferase [Strigomonas culicis]
MLRPSCPWAGSNSSSQWMQKQALDHFVLEARRKGYVARSAFKLSYLDDRFHLLDKTRTKAVIDLGCSPGGWCQVVRERAGDSCLLVGVDLLPVKATINNAVFLQGDFTSAALQGRLHAQLDELQLLPRRRLAGVEGVVDLITSDMCPNRTGGSEDRQRIAELNLRALQFSLPLLREGGHFVCKVLGSRASYPDLWHAATRHFLTAQACKPPASRAQSDEFFLVAHSRLAAPRKGLSPSASVGLGSAQQQSQHTYGLDDWPGFARRRSPKRRH